MWTAHCCSAGGACGGRVRARGRDRTVAGQQERADADAHRQAQQAWCTAQCPQAASPHAQRVAVQREGLAHVQRRLQAARRSNEQQQWNADQLHPCRAQRCLCWVSAVQGSTNNAKQPLPGERPTTTTTQTRPPRPRPPPPLRLHACIGVSMRDRVQALISMEARCSRRRFSCTPAGEGGSLLETRLQRSGCCQVARRERGGRASHSGPGAERSTPTCRSEPQRQLYRGSKGDHGGASCKQGAAPLPGAARQPAWRPGPRWRRGCRQRRASPRRQRPRRAAA